MAIIRGTQGNDQLRAGVTTDFDGTNDVVAGLAGADVINAGLAGTGGNVLSGGLGDDELIGNVGDSLFGDGGNDTLRAV